MLGTSQLHHVNYTNSDFHVTWFTNVTKHHLKNVNSHCAMDYDLQAQGHVRKITHMTSFQVLKHLN